MDNSTHSASKWIASRCSKFSGQQYDKMIHACQKAHVAIVLYIHMYIDSYVNQFVSNIASHILLFFLLYTTTNEKNNKKKLSYANGMLRNAHIYMRMKEKKRFKKHKRQTKNLNQNYSYVWAYYTKCNLTDSRRRRQKRGEREGAKEWTKKIYIPKTTTEK